MKKQIKEIKFIFDPIPTERDFEDALFWDSPATIHQLREGVKKQHGRSKK